MSDTLHFYNWFFYYLKINFIFFLWGSLWPLLLVRSIPLALILVSPTPMTMRLEGYWFIVSYKYLANSWELLCYYTKGNQYMGRMIEMHKVSHSCFFKVWRYMQLHVHVCTKISFLSMIQQLVLTEIAITPSNYIIRETNIWIDVNYISIYKWVHCIIEYVLNTNLINFYHCCVKYMVHKESVLRSNTMHLI